MLKLYGPFRNQDIFIICLFSIVQIWGLSVNFVFGSFLLIFCPVDLHFFADPDPGSQNLADPTDLDPKHCPES